MPYGQELILDIHNCNVEKFNRKDLTEFFKTLCEKIDMVREDLHFWDFEGMTEEEIIEAGYIEDHVIGTSAIQFIRTSNVTIHCLDRLKSVYINIFSCKSFNPGIVKNYVEEFFGGNIVCHSFIERI